MNALALLLVLGAAVAHASWNLIAKSVTGSGTAFVWLYSVVGALACLPLVVGTLLAEGGGLPWTALLAAAVSAVLHVVYSVVLQRGYAVGDLSVVYPVARGTGPVLAVLFAVLVLGERPGVLGFVGAAAVVVGVLVIAAGGARTPGRPRGLSVGYGLGTGVAIAAYTLWDDNTVTALGVIPTVYFGLTVLGNCVLLGPMALRQRAEVARLWRAHRGRVVAVGVLSPVAYILVLFAMRIAPVSLVAPVRETSIVLGALAGWLILREPNPLRRLLGSAVALAGIAAIAAS